MGAVRATSCLSRYGCGASNIIIVSVWVRREQHHNCLGMGAARATSCLSMYVRGVRKIMFISVCVRCEQHVCLGMNAV